MIAAAQFRDAIGTAGLIPPAVIEPGRFHRFPGASKKNGNTAGWCKLFPDGRGGIFGDFATGAVENWQPEHSRSLTHAEREAFRRNVEEAKVAAQAKRKAEHDAAARSAARLWSEAAPASDGHGYLTRKGVRPHGVRVYHGNLSIHGMSCDGALLVPIRNAAGELRSLQFIAAEKRTNGDDKRYIFSGERTGCYHSIGKPNGVICVVEGYATGASVHEAVGCAVAVASSANNLESVALALRAKLSDVRIIICADDDHKTPGNPGLAKATEAARAVGGLLAVPGFGDDRPEGATDFNDLASHAGAGAVIRSLANATLPDVREDQPARPNPAAVDSCRPEVRLIRGDAIKAEAVTWHWPGYLAAGKLHIVAGAPGTGKTTLAIGWAATITVGGLWPDGTRAPVGDVLIWSGEDAPGDTLVPRLLAAGANMARVHFVGEVRTDNESAPFDPAKHFPALALAASRLPDLQLMIVDPVVSAITGDGHTNTEVRRGLQPLVDFADGAGCVLLGITHFTKGTQGREPLERVTGSLGFGAVARVVMGTAKLKEEDGGGRVLVRVKNNLGPDGGGFKYEIEQVELTGNVAGIVASRVEWGAPIAGSAREILASAEQVDEEVGGENPKEFLHSLLAMGPMRASAVFRDAEAHGFSKRQMQRARAAIGAVIDKQGMQGGWDWSLPKVPLAPEDTEHAAQNNAAPSAPSAAPSVVDETVEMF